MTYSDSWGSIETWPRQRQTPASLIQRIHLERRLWRSWILFCPGQFIRSHTDNKMNRGLKQPGQETGEWILASDWSWVITWPGYWSLIGLFYCLDRDGWLFVIGVICSVFTYDFWQERGHQGGGYFCYEVEGVEKNMLLKWNNTLGSRRN